MFYENFITIKKIQVKRVWSSEFFYTKKDILNNGDSRNTVGRSTALNEDFTLNV